jgi:SAM-dependent methyltransferase
MDAPDADPAALGQSLRFIRRINTTLGYNRATAKVVSAMEPTSVLDVCCGSCDFRGYTDARYVGLDFHSGTLAFAAKAESGVMLVRGDAMTLPFKNNAFDVAVCQMALHHFDTPTALRLLSEMDRVSRRGWVASDLLRRRRAAMWIWLFTLLSMPMVRHDARLSVRQAWSPTEARELARRSGADFQFAFGHRFILTKTQ